MLLVELDEFERLQRDAEGLSHDEQNQRYQELGRAFMARQGIPYDPSALSWADAAPEDVRCGCYEWRRYPVPQRHFGFAGWRTCGPQDCSCKCHVGQVWTAAVPKAGGT